MVSAEQVRSAAMKAGRTRIESRDCSMCGYMMAYIIHDGGLYYDPGCYCGRRQSAPEPRGWGDAADWINMQTQEEHRQRIAYLFGIIPEMTAADLDMEA